jgi:hypothetical protein
VDKAIDSLMAEYQRTKEEYGAAVSALWDQIGADYTILLGLPLGHPLVSFVQAEMPVTLYAQKKNGKVHQVYSGEPLCRYRSGDLVIVAWSDNDGDTIHNQARKLKHCKKCMEAW